MENKDLIAEFREQVEQLKNTAEDLQERVATEGMTEVSMALFDASVGLLKAKTQLMILELDRQ